LQVRPLSAKCFQNRRKGGTWRYHTFLVFKDSLVLDMDMSLKRGKPFFPFLEKYFQETFFQGQQIKVKSCDGETFMQRKKVFIDFQGLLPGDQDEALFLT
jgi:hypothetical protein